jgi:hypothetical protein
MVNDSNPLRQEVDTDPFSISKRARQEALEGLREILQRFAKEGKITKTEVSYALRQLDTYCENNEVFIKLMDNALLNMAEGLKGMQSQYWEMGVVQRAFEMILIERGVIEEDDVMTCAQKIVKEINKARLEMTQPEVDIPTSKA